MKLREYQQECIDIIKQKETGNYLVQLATGLGKTVIFSEIINNNSSPCLIISHREELVYQPIKYINKKVGVEMGKTTSNGEDVVSSCINTLVNRFDKFPADYFDIIVVDECQHSVAKTYFEVLTYFKPRLLLGFTATPNRSDNLSLQHLYDEIIYEKDILWGIKNKYLVDIQCKRVYVKFDLKKCRSNRDYNLKDLEMELERSENSKSVSEIYKKYAKGQTLIFGINNKHCKDIQEKIPGSVVINASTKNRSEIIEDFKQKKISCIVNCMIFTEGTDIPGIDTIIIARPTKSSSLYLQMVGRGLRLAENKQHLNLIDIVGVSTDLNLCNASTLVGIEYNDTYQDKKYLGLDLDTNLFDLPEVIEKRENCPEIWAINYKLINVWAKKKNYNLHNVNWFKHSDGSLSLTLKKLKIKTSPIDNLGNIIYNEKKYKAQKFFDLVFKTLVNKFSDQAYIWDMNKMKSWGYKPASPKQLMLIKKFLPEKKFDNLNKLQACQILNKLILGGKK